MLHLIDSESLEDTQTQHRAIAISHRQSIKKQATVETAVFWSKCEYMSIFREQRVRDWKEKKDIQWHKHTFLLSVAVEFCDCVYRRNKLKLSAVSLLNSHSVITLSTETKQDDSFYWRGASCCCANKKKQHSITDHLLVCEVKDTLYTMCSFVQLDSVYVHKHRKFPRSLPLCAPTSLFFIHSLSITVFKDWMLCPCFYCQGNQGKLEDVDAVLEHFFSFYCLETHIQKNHILSLRSLVELGTNSI